MTRRVTRLSVLTALFVASMTAIMGSLAPVIVSAAAVDPTGGSPTIDTSLNQWLDRSTILYNGTYYFDNKIDDNYTYDSQNAGADGCIDQIRFPSDGNTTATLYHNTKDPADPKCITSKKTQIDLTHAERSNMPFEFIDGNTIETSDKKNTYTYNDAKNAFLETGGDGCKDIVQVLNSDGKVMSRTTLSNSLDGSTSLSLAVTARTAGNNTAYDSWDSSLEFSELKHSVPSKDASGCTNYGPHKYTASLALLNNPDTLGDAPNAALPPGGANASTLSLDCKAGYNPLNWLICGVVDGLVKIIATVDNMLNGLLSIGTSGTSGTDPIHLFSTSDPSGKGYFDAWKSFRNIALGLLVIIGLVIIIAQEVGSDLIDAYTVRKTLPRLVVAAVGITLSWELMRFFVEFTNSLGYGIRALIYAPFTTGGATTNVVALGGGGDTAVSLIAGVASIALGIFGLLSFVATAALAIFIAFVVLVLRQIIIILLVILAPIAIVAYILPNTKKLYDLWWDSFSRALILFPIISGLIAIGRVFSYEASQSANTTNSNGLGTGSVSASVQHIIAFIAYFAPYFLIPFTLKFAGGALARLGAVANNPTRGAFNRLSNFRANQQKKRITNAGQRARTGRVFRNSPEGSIRSKLNTGIQSASLLNQAGVRPDRIASNIRAARTTTNMGAIGEAMERDPHMKAVLGNDDLLMAAIDARGTDEDARNYLYSKGYRGADLEQNVSQIRQAKRAVGEQNFAVAAAVANAGTGTGYGDGAGEMLETIQRVSRGDQVLAGNMLAQAKSRAEGARRFDLSGASYGTLLGQMQRIGNAPDDAERARAVADANEYVTDRALDALGPGAVLGGRGGSVQNFIPAMQRRTQRVMTNWENAMASGDQARIQVADRDRQQMLASTAGLLDVASQVSPENARRLADGLLQATTHDITGAEITIGQMIEAQRNDREFMEMRREYGASTRGQYDNAQRQAMMGGGAGGPNTVPPIIPPTGP